jgi:isoquinoline 1-oxidoreductase beta subunit
MLIATVQRCPVFGGKVASYDATKAKTIKGVRQVVQISSGVAVVADSYWAAKKGREALNITWDEGPNAQLSSAEITRIYAETAKQPGPAARKEGDAVHACQCCENHGRRLRGAFSRPCHHGADELHRPRRER